MRKGGTIYNQCITGSRVLMTKPFKVEESISEDAHLSGELGYHYVRGMQGGNVSATIKHFVGVSNPEQGLNTGPVHGGERELRTT